MPISAEKYRGATVEDLSPPPALSLTPTTPIHHALLTALSHDYTHLTVLAPHSPSLATSPSPSTPTSAAMASRSPLLGYLSIPHLQSLLASHTVSEDDDVSKAMIHFDRKPRKGHQNGKGGRYQVITMATPLEDLEAFFEGEVQTAEEGGGKEATGKQNGGNQKQEFAVVTDQERKFVLGIATREDLEEFVRRRPR